MQRRPVARQCYAEYKGNECPLRGPSEIFPAGNPHCQMLARLVKTAQASWIGRATIERFCEFETPVDQDRTQAESEPNEF
jgi:hypothetical protein